MSNELKIQRVFGVWQLFDGALKKPGQLLNLKQAAFHTQNPVATNQFGNQRSSRRELFHTVTLGDVQILVGRLEHQHVDIQIAQDFNNLLANLGPLQTTVASA
ncbi:hypothetical protein D3C80_1869670 [compost metagenome]